jgi:hypothetical protein
LESVSGGCVFHGVIFARHGLLVRVFPVLIASELLDNLRWVDKLLEVLAAVGEMNLGCDNGVKPG